MRYVLNPLGPQRLVQLRVKSHILRAHGLLGELHDGLDSPRRALLERAAVHAFVQVDGVFAGDDVFER